MAQLGFLVPRAIIKMAASNGLMDLKRTHLLNFLLFATIIWNFLKNFLSKIFISPPTLPPFRLFSPGSCTAAPNPSYAPEYSLSQAGNWEIYESLFLTKGPWKRRQAIPGKASFIVFEITYSIHFVTPFIYNLSTFVWFYKLTVFLIVFTSSVEGLQQLILQVMKGNTHSNSCTPLPHALWRENKLKNASILPNLISYITYHIL